ncbi:PA2169 family four-helix-bundle protein [Litorimonas haliclonae]|uniref:PA2169 family four-helix-bundle protein n=1 Tax=Litorimonas haliclonae TaxID=2081977 RepID=UPI0039EF81E4
MNQKELDQIEIDQTQIDILNDVTQTLIDSYEGYKICLEDMEEGYALRSHFSRRAASRSQLISEFQTAVRDLGGEPVTKGSVSGAAHRGWTKLTALFQDDEKAARQAVDDGERFLAERINEQLRDPGLTPNTQVLLRNAYASATKGGVRTD